jgi:hypothetical protein
MSQIIVALESRKFQEISDLMHKFLKEELDKLNAKSSRISVPRPLDMPCALNTVMHHTVCDQKWQKPAAYIVMLTQYMDDVSSFESKQIFHQFFELSRIYQVPVIPALHVLERYSKTVDEIEKNCQKIVMEAVQSCIALIELQQKMNAHTRP